MTSSGLSLLSSGPLVAGACLLVAAALHDCVARTVPNWVAGVLAITGLMLRATFGNLLAGTLVGLVVFVLAVLCWRRGWMGGGDVKLLAATAILVPPALAFNFITAVALFGGVLAVLYLLGRRVVPAPHGPRPRGFLARVLRIERWRIHRGGPLPYACAIAAGGLFVLL